MRRIATLAVAIALMACGSASTSPGVVLVGTYTLRNVNGSSLPVTLADGTRLTSDVLALASDGSFTDSQQFLDGRVQVVQGFYTSTLNALTFQDQSTNATFQASLNGVVLTAFVDGLRKAYQKN